jgi:hypothetical protein
VALSVAPGTLASADDRAMSMQPRREPTALVGKIPLTLSRRARRPATESADALKLPVAVATVRARVPEAPALPVSVTWAGSMTEAIFAPKGTSVLEPSVTALPTSDATKRLEAVCLPAAIVTVSEPPARTMLVTVCGSLYVTDGQLASPGTVTAGASEASTL